MSGEADNVELHAGADKDARIRTIYVWIAVHENGGEGIMSADMPWSDEGQIRHVPLMTTRLRTAAGPMGDMARRIQQEIKERLGQIITIKLRKFRVEPP